MTIKDFVALEKRLIPSLPQFIIKGPLMFIAPLGHTLRGFYFEGSDFDKTSFYVNVFFLPLCVPAEQVSLNFGDRLRIEGSDRWSVSDPDFETTLGTEMQNAARSLTALRTPEDVVETLKSRVRYSSDPYIYEAIAYMLARQGKREAALDALDGLVKMLDPSIQWELNMASRAHCLKTKLVESPGQAKKQLDAWESETVRNLGLEACRA